MGRMVLRRARTPLAFKHQDLVPIRCGWSVVLFIRGTLMLVRGYQRFRTQVLLSIGQPSRSVRWNGRQG